MCLKPRGFMWVSTTKIAQIEGVTSQTIRRKVEAGFYKKVMKTSGGHYRIFLNHERQVVSDTI